MTTKELNENSVYNWTEMPTWQFSDGVTLLCDVPEPTSFEEKVKEFQLKYPSILKSFKEQQNRDLLEFIKVYLTKQGDSEWDF